MMLALSKDQLALCEAADKVEDQFSDTGTAMGHLIKPLLEAGYLVKTKSRKTPYVFTEAGCIAVTMWRAINRARAALV